MRKRISKLKIQQKILLYLLGFAVFILCIFYLAQVVFLKDFYMFIKERGVKQATDQIKNILKESYDYNQIQTIASAQDFVCIHMAWERIIVIHTILRPSLAIFVLVQASH